MTAPRCIDLATLSPAGAQHLGGEIAAARLVCFPTDTVYGIGGPLSAAVYVAVVAAKGRDAGKPLQVIYPSLELLEAAVTLTPRLRDAVRRLLPGPFTLLLPYPADMSFPPPGELQQDAHEPRGVRPAPAHSLRSTPTLGVRVPAWPRAARALAGLPFALLASSANPSGAPAPRSLGEVDGGLLAACDLALDAGPVGGRASTIVDLSAYESDGRWRVLRTGTVGDADVAELLRGVAAGSVVRDGLRRSRGEPPRPG